MSYVYRGIVPHMRAALEAHPGLDRRHSSSVSKADAVVKVDQALAQASNAPPAVRCEIASNALLWREALQLALDGVDSAIMEVYTELELPIPGFLGGGTVPSMGVVVGGETRVRGEGVAIGKAVDGGDRDVVQRRRRHETS